MSAWYGVKRVLFDVDIEVRPGQVVALIGHNGAGKSTLAKCIVNHGVRREGHCDLADVDTEPGTAAVSLVPQGIGTFPSLTVRENILLGAVAVHLAPRGSEAEERMSEVLEFFPDLVAKLDNKASDLSGGQRQMVSISRSLMGRPRCLIADEASVGLAPLVVHGIMDVIAELAKKGSGVLLIEQNLTEALRVADDVVVMKSGRIFHRESAVAFRQRSDLWEYF